MKKGAVGDMTLESRHLVGLFLGVVVLCCVFFTLGYVMARSQPGAVEAAGLGTGVSPASVPAPGSLPGAVKPDPAELDVPAPADWHYPSAAEAAKPAAKLEPQKPKVALNRPPVTPPRARPTIGSAPGTETRPVAAKSSVTPPPLVAKGAIVLQVAALTRESDALALANAIQRKSFPSYVSTPVGNDKFYRVQVGPYGDMESAEIAKKSLLREGFKVIVKR